MPVPFTYSIELVEYILVNGSEYIFFLCTQKLVVVAYFTPSLSPPFFFLFFFGWTMTNPLLPPTTYTHKQHKQFNASLLCSFYFPLKHTSAPNPHHYYSHRRGRSLNTLPTRASRPFLEKNSRAST